MKSSQEYLRRVERSLGLHDAPDADSTLLNSNVVRVLFDDCLPSGRVEELKKKIVNCCDSQCHCELEQFNCHILDIVKR